MASLDEEPKLPTSPSAAPASPTAEVTKSARLIVNMKRELMELIKAEHFETALTICDRRTSRPPPPARVHLTLLPLSPSPHAHSLFLVPSLAFVIQSIGAAP